MTAERITVNNDNTKHNDNGEEDTFAWWELGLGDLGT